MLDLACLLTEHNDNNAARWLAAQAAPSMERPFVPGSPARHKFDALQQQMGEPAAAIHDKADKLPTQFLLSF